MNTDALRRLVRQAGGRLLAAQGLLEAEDPGAAETQIETLAEELARALDADKVRG